MSVGTLKKETREALMHVSTATLTTALFKRGLRNQFIQNVQPLSEKGKNMVGQAYTMRYIPAREDLNPITVFTDPTHPQRVGVEAIPSGCVLVMDSRKDARAASAGSILVTRMMKRGVEGVVTDGGFRDSPEIGKMDIRCYHQRPSAPTNLTLHQAIELDVPIGCGDVAVFPGDVMVGDDEGVVVVPFEMADDIAIEGREMTAYEDFVLERVQAGDSIVGLYPGTKEESQIAFKKWREANNR